MLLYVWIGFKSEKAFLPINTIEYEVLWKVLETSLTWCVRAWYALSNDWVTVQNEEGCWQTPEVLGGRSSKQNNPVLMWKWEFSRFSACHLAVLWSWAGHHTSFERGYSGLPADMKIRTVTQLIGILWSYFGTLRGLPMRLDCLTSYQVIPHSNQGYHTSFDRVDNGLSANPNCLHVSLQVSLIWHQSYLKWGRPRTSSLRWRRLVQMHEM